MNDTPENQIVPFLMPNESLLWSGRPRQGVLFRPADAYLIPFSLLWAGFAVFWEFGVITSGAPLFFTIWGVPFVLVGLYIVIGRFFVDAWVRSRTAYALTTQRVLIVGGHRTHSVKSLRLNGLPEMSFTQRSDGSGSITFGASTPWWAVVSGWPGATKSQTPAFESVNDVRSVFDRILSAQADAPSSIRGRQV